MEHLKKERNKLYFYCNKVRVVKPDDSFNLS